MGSAQAGTAGAAGPVLQPEKEVASSYKAPVATGHFVWITNPTSGRVAYVDATSLAVSTVEAGDGPTYLTAVPGTADAVIVLNTLSNDATYLSASGTTLTSRTIPNVAPGSNGWAVSPDGRFALAWTDARLVPAAPDTQGFHDVTIIDLQAAASAPASTTLAVGYRPISIGFAADSSRAFAVTQDGVSVVALAKPAVVDTVPLGENGMTDAADTQDVSITPDGKLAVVRRDGSAVVGVVDLASHARTDFTLSGAVTDIVVSADGARAVAVVRDTAEVAVLPLAGSAPAAAAVQHVTITGETIGQVTLAAGGLEAVLFSNATPAERLTVLTLGSTPTFHVVKLHASVLSALPTPDGMFAVVLHPTVAPVIETPNPDGGAADAAAAAATTPPPPATAFSLVPLDGTQPARIEMTNAPIQAVAIAPTSDRVLLSVLDTGKQIYGAYLGLLPTLEVRTYPLASPPVATGVVGGANRGYIAQQYPDGRITFITLDSGDARTLTGYELGARVVEWNK
ncbi:MAG TPA: hypothetical protein VMT47_15925 [Polyangia bacterium]|nr:hypothetical protein [Polyangia bacterium]